jgi:hypothetical protein
MGVYSCLSHPACKSHLFCSVLYCHLPTSTTFLSHYLTSGDISGKNHWVENVSFDYLYTYVWNISHSKNSTTYYVKYPLIWSDFNQTWLSRDFRKILKYQSSRKSVHWEPRCPTHTHRQTWRCYQSLSQFGERAWKETQTTSASSQSSTLWWRSSAWTIDPSVLTSGEDKPPEARRHGLPQNVKNTNTCCWFFWTGFRSSYKAVFCIPFMISGSNFANNYTAGPEWFAAPPPPSKGPTDRFSTILVLTPLHAELGSPISNSQRHCECGDYGCDGKDLVQSLYWLHYYVFNFVLPIITF